jgi:hypothetical protein
MHVVERIFKKCDYEEIKLFVGIARRLCLQRNEMVRGGSFIHPNVLVQNTKDVIVEFHQVNILDA